MPKLIVMRPNGEASCTNPSEAMPERICASTARASSAVWNLSPDEIALEAETGEQPGLYLIAAVPEEADGRDQAQPRLVGFWLSFGAAYLSEGPVGPPDQVPPWVEPLLEVLVEEVWWSNFPYYSTRQREWRMPIVLEWTPPVASRAEFAPPGDPRPVVPRVEAPRRGAASAQPWGEPIGGFSREDDDGEDVWLSDVGQPSLPREAPRPTPISRHDTLPPTGPLGGPAPSNPPEPPPKLPAKRSVLCLVEARLQVSARLHRASFQVLSPDRFPSSATPAAWPAWILELPPGEVAMTGAHRLGPPLELPGDRVGFPATGWLTRGLTLWPHAPADVQAGRLPDRVVQSKLRGQAAQASTLLLSVIAAVIGVTATLRLIAEPRPQPSEAPAPSRARPSSA